MLCSVNKAPIPLNYQPLLLVKAALLSRLIQHMILVATQSPAQVMSMATA
ncbi:hypothetical protein BAZSYMA_ACONTIG06588_1 [Bathymodiolus azoricus thioautotrophic gill symbiont]|uniref:Uncharacterized protein n=1 Tax=Bathymodiolus azoricus thioautotrophic gill symbiont TaxID=235205 RepID=A0A1H6KWX9_9GAMM|nr:hypothetical protein BAZSYMA_ACONTIG06588_1 [Bathymodiolus azoricus thioautotrophic gill symbiont]